MGARLRSLRKQRGWSQGELGKMLGVTFQQVQKYEKGGTRISAARLREIGHAFGVHSDYFFEGLPEAAGNRAGLAEGQEQLRPGDNSRSRENEVAELVQAYSRITDPAVRERILALVKVLQPEAD